MLLFGLTTDFLFAFVCGPPQRGFDLLHTGIHFFGGLLPIAIGNITSQTRVPGVLRPRSPGGSFSSKTSYCSSGRPPSTSRRCRLLHPSARPAPTLRAHCHLRRGRHGHCALKAVHLYKKTLHLDTGWARQTTKPSGRSHSVCRDPINKSCTVRNYSYEKINRLSCRGDCVTSSRSLCRRTDGIFEASYCSTATSAA